MARLDPGAGLLIPDPRLILDNQTSTSGTAASAYTQAGPHPGTPVPAAGSPWRPQIVGAQDVDIEVATIRGGFPGREGASILYRKGSETLGGNWRGWSEPNLLVDWSAPDDGWGASANFDTYACCTIPATGVVVVYVNSTTGTNGRIFRYDPRTETWSDGYDFTSAAWSLDDDQVDLVWDPERDRLLLFTGEGGKGDPTVIALWSDDYGDNWQPFSIGYFDTDTLTNGRLSIAPAPGVAWCALSGIFDLSQWVSVDGGVSWELVDSGTNVLHNDLLECLPLKSGGFLALYAANSTQYPTAIKLGSAQTAFTSVTAEVIESIAIQSLAACVDDDGMIYIIARDDTASQDDRVLMWRSADEGETWERYDYDVIDGMPSAGGCDMRITAACGQLHCVHGERASGGFWHSSLGEPFGVWHLGGWGTLENGTGSNASYWERTARTAWGVYGGSGSVSAEALCWFPADLPTTFGWTASGAGTVDLTAGPYLDISTGSGVAQFYFTNFTKGAFCCGQEVVQVVSGGSTTQPDIGIEVTVADGTDDFELRICLTTTGITARDPHGTATSTTAQVDMTAWVRIRWQVVVDGTRGYASVWYQELGSTQWIEIWDGEEIGNDTSTPNAQSTVRWGHVDNVGVRQSRWRMAGWSPSGDWRTGIDIPPALGDTLVNSHDALGLTWGHPVPARAVGSYPVPDAASSSLSLGRVAGVGGPTHRGETVDLPTAYTHGIRQIYPQLSPVPSKYWESTDDSEVIWAWDGGSTSGAFWVGSALGLLVHGAYARQWALEYSGNGSVWTTAGTLDLAVGTSLNSSRNGRVFYPRAGTNDVDEYIAEGALVGGYVIASAGGGTLALRIVRNSGGYWTASAVNLIRIEVEGDPSTADTSGTVDIIAPSGVLVAYPTSLVTQRYWRVKVAASQATPGGVYRAGVVLPGRIVGLGEVPGWDWSRRVELSRRTERRRDGNLDVEETGKPRQSLTWGWTDGLLISKLRGKANGGEFADYLGISGGQPLAADEDPWHTLRGVVEHGLQSGQLPCALLARLPSSTGTILDPDLWLYGRLLSDSFGVTNVSGTEGVDETLRLDGVSFEELR